MTEGDKFVIRSPSPAELTNLIARADPFGNCLYILVITSVPHTFNIHYYDDGVPSAS
jgi:hypothetical protein